LRGNLSWKLFIPETGFVNLPNLYFNEVGTFRIQLHNLKTGDLFFSAPICCVQELDRELYWGLLHGESERADAVNNLDTCLRLLRDEKSLQFFASSPFESSDDLSPEVWKSMSAKIAESSADLQLTTFLGFQWFEEPPTGLRQIIYAKDNKPLIQKKGNKGTTIKKIYKSYTPKDILSIPCFTMAKGYETTFETFDPDFERVVEIYNAWGSSECLKNEGNPRPISSKGKGISESEKGSIRSALQRNCRFGFVAGGLDDRGVYSSLFDSDHIQYSEGLTAILAPEQTREALFLALYNRACYATTGERIVLNFSISRVRMGGEVSTKVKPGLAFNRHIVGSVAGTTPLKTIEIIRNGDVMHTFRDHPSSFDFTFDDSTPLEQIALASPDDRPYFVYYYLRIIQQDGHMAWSSPIWIDYPEISEKKEKRKPPKKGE